MRVAIAESAALAYGGDPGDDDDDDALDDKVYLAKSEAGLFTLQLLDAIICLLATSQSKSLRTHILRGLYEAGSSLHDSWANAEEMMQTIFAADEAAAAKTPASGGPQGANVAQRRAMASMEEGVKALLARYAAAAEGTSEAAEGKSDA